VAHLLLSVPILPAPLIFYAGGFRVPAPISPPPYQPDAPRPSPRTNRTSRVPPPVLIGHAVLRMQALLPAGLRRVQQQQTQECERAAQQLIRLADGARTDCAPPPPPSLPY